MQGITDLITVPGIVNLDFADVRTIMRNAGSALMGIGVGQGENRSAEAARAAVSSPLLESSIDGATGILLNITGPADLGLFEVNEAAEVVTSAADQNANVIFGAVIDETRTDEVRVTVIATGFGQQRRRRTGGPGTGPGPGPITPGRLGHRAAERLARRPVLPARPVAREHGRPEDSRSFGAKCGVRYRNDLASASADARRSRPRPGRTHLSARLPTSGVWIPAPWNACLPFCRTSAPLRGSSHHPKTRVSKGRLPCHR